MAAIQERKRLNRSPRFDAPLDRDATFVHISEVGTDEPSRGALLADISDSGMRLISRVPVSTKVGDILNVDFTLAGSAVQVKGRALVVRKMDEFVFAVRFLTKGERLKTALREHLAFRHRGFFARSLPGLLAWVSAHRQGLFLTLAGFVVIGAAALYLVLHSDEYLKRNMRSWGEDLPREYYTDYIKHFPKY